MGNNLDCSNKNHKLKFTLWNLLWEIPLPSCSFSPKKQILTSLSGFTLMPFLFSLPIHALKDLKPLCKFTLAPLSQDFAKCMVYRSSQLTQHKNKLHWSYLNCASAILCLKPFTSLGKTSELQGVDWESWGEWVSSGLLDQLVIVEGQVKLAKWIKKILGFDSSGSCISLSVKCLNLHSIMCLHATFQSACGLSPSANRQMGVT